MKASILFITYQHEAFVAEAIRSAMAQDYPYLEIVICDDASTDATRRILEVELEKCNPRIELVRSYSERNVGLINVFNRGMNACTGDVVVAMSGDDFSIPCRVSRIMAEFLNNPRCMLVCSNWKKIDRNSMEIPNQGCNLAKDQVFRYKNKVKNIYAWAPVCGATAAYRATLSNFFGPMLKGHHAEDNCYWFRGLLMGDIHYIATPLVNWRSHHENLSNWDRSNDSPLSRIRYLRFLHKHQNFSIQWKSDLNLAITNSIISLECARKIELTILYHCESVRLFRYSLSAAPMKIWWSSAWRLVIARPNLKIIRKTILKQLRLRLASDAREQFWKKHFDNESPITIDLL